jgi:hypothetical protein
MSKGLRMGEVSASRRCVLKAFLLPLLGALVLHGQIHAQEVVVLRETKPEAPKPAAQPSETPPPESATPTPTKPKARPKKSASNGPTVEEMRAAGARAAEALNNQSVSQSARTNETESDTTAARTEAVSATATPERREVHVEQKSTPRPSKPPSTKEGVGSIRPTMIESGRQEPSASPTPKWQGREEQSPAP